MHQDCISPHQLPLAWELVRRLGAENFRYVYRDKTQSDRARLGWRMDGGESWFVHIGSFPTQARELIENADTLLTMFRDVALIRRRCAKGLVTFYDSERWFKPIAFSIGRVGFSVPGFVRLLNVTYLKMVVGFVRLARRYPNFVVLPIGVHARRDFARIGVPQSKMRTWGYFVAPSEKKNDSAVDLDLQSRPSSTITTNPLRVLWVGRMLKLKNVDTLIRAVACANKKLAKIHSTTTTSDYNSITLTLVGSGPEESSLKKLASALQLQIETITKSANSIVDLDIQPRPLSLFTFQPSVSIDKVRELMRAHDVYVFPSNGYDGWGAVVSEAMEEGMIVLGSNQAGAPATMLPPTHRFNCRDYKRLSDLLLQVVKGDLNRIPIGDWTAKRAAERLMECINLRRA